MHGMIKSNVPMQGNSYNKLNNVYLDNNFEMISDEMISFLNNANKITYITVELNEQIYGNSYEMALVLLMLGYNNVTATGVIRVNDGKRIEFGEIAGLSSKLKIDKDILHNKIIDHVELSPY